MRFTRSFFALFILCCVLLCACTAPLANAIIYFVFYDDLNLINHAVVSIILVHVFGNISTSLKNVWIVE